MVFGIILPVLVELIADPIKKHVVTPIKRHISYAFKCDSNVQRLQQQVEQLQNKKDTLQQSVDAAARNGDDIFSSVTDWLMAADRDMREAGELIQRNEEAKRKCCFGFCPDLRTRYQLSKGVDRKALAIGKLCNEQGLDPISLQPPLEPIMESSLYSGEALSSRVLMLNQVMEALKDPSLDMIGIYGMGGIGKTTLAKEVLRRAMQEKMFDTVVMVVVSQMPEIRRIQAEIADFLGLRFSVEEMPGRANQLYRRLEKSKVLIILDDLWHEIDFNAVGIPSQGASKGCKIMLTSRSRDVLWGMRAQKLFLLEPLNEKETMSLFQMSAPEANNPEFHAVATQLAQRCAGLPLMIQIVAAELRNKELYVWHDTLNKLSTSEDDDVNQKVGRVIELSYHNLPGWDSKSLFLLCALFGQHDIRIQFLLTYSMGMGLFKSIYTIEEARLGLLTLISKLKAASLLLDGDLVGFVKMHNVVRDIALRIASREQHSFVGSGEVSLGDFADKDCTRIALPFCNISKLPVGLSYPAAELFLLHTEDLSLDIPDSFFDGIRKLKVVDFTGMHLVHLPSSIGLLANVRTLCLHRCRLDNVGILGVLQKLEFLSFANSNIVELPKEIEHLVRLKLLDLRSCSYLQVIPASVLSKLCSLEELYVLNSFVRWDAQDNVSLVELENLACLSTLEIHIPDLKLIPVGFQCFSRLESYKISIGNVWNWDEEQYERSRTLKLQGEAGAHLVGGTELLLRESEDLYLDGVSGIQSIFNEGFPKAKHMHIENDFDIQHLIKSTQKPPRDAFPVLESLYLNKLQNLEKICSGQLRTESIGALQILRISNCERLKSLFSFSSGKCLQQLRELEVESCENMEAVVDEGIEEVHHNHGMMEFTQLSSLKLKDLPHLFSICKLKEVSFPNLTNLEVNECHSLKHIFTASMEAEEIEDVHHNNEVVNFINLTSLKLKKLPNLIGFCKCKEEVEETGMLFSTMVSFPNLSSLEVNGCQSLKYIFTTSKEGLAGEGIEDVHTSNEEMEFINLSSLKLKNLPKLIGFCKSKDETEQTGLLFNTMVSLHNLTSLEVNGCKSLMHIFTTSKEGVVGKRIKHVYRKNEVIELTKLSSLKLKKLPLLTGFCQSKEEDEQTGLLFSAMISFPNLTSLEVNGCKSLKHISTASTMKCLMQLISLKIEDCELDGEIIQSKIVEETEEDITKRIVFPKLDCLSLLNLKNVKRFSHRYSFEFPLLSELTVEGCHTMRNFVGNVSCSESEEEEYVFDKNVGFSNLERIDVGESSRDGRLLEDLQPHQNIKRIHIKYYTEEQLPSWLLRMKSPSSSDSFLILNNLVDLKLEWCNNCVQLPCLGNLPHLKFMEMSHMGQVKCIDKEFYGVSNQGSSDGCSSFFPALQSLSMTWMENLTEWSSPSGGKPVKAFPCLQNLSIQSCPKLTGFPMSDLPKLVRLEIKDCHELKLAVHEQQSFSFLARLSITGYSKLTYLRTWLQSTLSFEELIVRKCEWLTFIPYDLQKVSYLTSLEIYCCRRLRHFPGDVLSKLRRLQNLSIGAFSEELDDFHYLNRIEDLPCLEELEIWGSDFFGREMCHLPNQLQHLRVLKSLKLMGFTAMEALPEWLTNLQSLRLLSLDHCQNLGCQSTATIIQQLPNLSHLSASSCPVLQGRESEWLLPSYSRKIDVELSLVSKVRVRLGQ